MGVAVVVLVFSHVAKRNKFLFLSGGVSLQSPLYVYGTPQKRLGVLVFLDPKLGFSEEMKTKIQDTVNHAVVHWKDYRMIPSNTVDEILEKKTAGKVRRTEKMLVHSGKADVWLFVELLKAKNIRLKLRLTDASGANLKEVTREVSSREELFMTLKSLLQREIS